MPQPRGDQRARHVARGVERAADQLERGRPVEPHAALRRVHRLGDAEAERPEVLPIGDASRPSRRAAVEPRIDRGERVGDDVRRGVGDAVEAGASAGGVARRGSRSAQGASAPSATRQADRQAHGDVVVLDVLEAAQSASGGTSIQRRSFQLSSAASTSCTPLAPSRSVPLVRRVLDDVADEELPLDLEAVVVDLRVGHLLPLVEEVHRLLHVGVPHRPRRRHARLDAAVGQAGDRRAVRAVDLEGDEVVAAHARRPRHVDLRDHRLAVALELARRVGGVVGGRLVGLAGLVPALRDVRRAEAGHRLHLAEQVVEHVAPVAHHVEDDAAAVFAAVVPRRALDRLQVALEHPVAELAAHRQHAAEEAGAAQHVELAQAGQEELVLDHAVLHARRPCAMRAISSASSRLVAIGFSQ